MNEDITILVVEDDIDLGNVLAQYLKMNQYKVDLCRSGEEAMEVFRNKTFQIGILDIMLPGMDGFQLAEKILETKPEFPIIFLTARNQKIDKIKGLSLGVDDYITKPFDPEELLLRLKNILKRTGTSQSEYLSIGKYKFFPRQFELRYNQESKTLTEREASLLKLLLMHKNEVLERKFILETVWGEDDFFLGRSMDVFVTRLRKYLKKDSSIEIKSIRGVGLMLSIR